MAILGNAPQWWRRVWQLTDVPSVAIGLSCLWVLAFILEQQLAVVPGIGLQPDGHTNIALGALAPSSVMRGQWWRFLINPLLHGGPVHLVTDIIALIGIGATFEAAVGRAWFCTLFVLTAVVGEIVSLLIHPTSPGTIGPAGTVMGILAANFVCSFHFRDAKLRNRMQLASARYLLPALISTFKPQGFPVDIGGHIGGTLAGAAFGCALLSIWPKDSARPKFEAVAFGLSRLYAVAGMMGFAAVWMHYSDYVVGTAELIPPREWPRSGQEGAARSQYYINRYPRDGYAHIFRGDYFLLGRDFQSAEREYRTALKLEENSVFGPEKIDVPRAMLAEALWHEGRIMDAEAAVEPSCYSDNSDPRFHAVIKDLRTGRICGQ